MIKKLKKEIRDNKLYIILYVIILILAVIWNVGIGIIAGVTVLCLVIFYSAKKTRKSAIHKFIDSIFKKAMSDIAHKKFQTILLVIILILLVIWKQNIETVALWMLFFSFLFYDWENRIVAGLALLALASCPFLLIYKKEALAEIMAIYAYYFLAMTVALQIVELKRHPEEFEEVESL